MPSGPDMPASVLLFSMPWMKATWPSLALGCLKAYLAERGVTARCCHFHLEAAARLGSARYDALAESWGAGEALFSSLLDRDEAPRLVAVASKLLRDAGRHDAATWAEGSACDDLAALVDEWLERERPEEYELVGGSIGALQLSATLYLMQRIRARGHDGVRVLGGSGLVGMNGRELLDRAPDVHAVIQGEGEAALLGVVQSMGTRPLAGLPGVLARDAAGAVVPVAPLEPVDLSEVPAPDVGEFFEAAAALGVPRTALTLSFEYSRGCEWEHRTDGRLRGCTFCGLYRNSPNHRRKPVARVLRDIDAAVKRFRVLSIAFVDAYLPAGYRDELLDGINSLPFDVTFFTELRCDLTEATVQRLSWRANRVQLGVESFSSAILKRIGKGVSAARTVHSVRLCQDYGIPAQYNLMLGIPGVPADEIDELAATLPTLFGLEPPKVTEFYLDRNSLAFADPIAHGIAPATIDGERPQWLAGRLGDSRILQVVPFGPADLGSAAAWERLGEPVRQWRERWQAAAAARLKGPLTWRRGRDWATVIDVRREPARVLTLEGVLFDVFLACREVVSEQRLAELLPQHSPDAVSEALQELIRHGLVLADGQAHVSLPVYSGSTEGRRAHSVSTTRVEPGEVEWTAVPQKASGPRLRYANGASSDDGGVENH